MTEFKTRKWQVLKWLPTLTKLCKTHSFSDHLCFWHPDIYVSAPVFCILCVVWKKENLIRETDTAQLNDCQSNLPHPSSSIRVCKNSIHCVTKATKCPHFHTICPSMEPLKSCWLHCCSPDLGSSWNRHDEDSYQESLSSVTSFTPNLQGPVVWGFSCILF